MASSLEQVGGNYGQIIRDFLAVAHADDGSLRNAGSTTLANVLASGNDAGGLKIANLLNPTNPGDAATKAYADALIVASQTLLAVLTVSNDAGTLKIVNLGEPASAQDAATKHYVDNAAATAKSLAQVLAVGNDANALKILNLAAPALSTDAATKGYVDARTLAQILAVGADAGATRIVNLGAPSVSTDAATKAYVDALTRTLVQVLAAGASAGGATITNLGTPVNQTDAATKDYVDAALLNNQAGSYTLVAADVGQIVNFTAGTAVTLTIPLNSSVPFETSPRCTEIRVRQAGAGQVTIGGPGAGAGGGTAGGVTVVNPYTSFSLFGTNAEAKLIKVGTDKWSLNGEVA